MRKLIAKVPMRGEVMPFKGFEGTDGFRLGLLDSHAQFAREFVQRGLSRPRPCAVFGSSCVKSREEH